MFRELPNIYFVGLMGSGKSTVGRIVANRMGRPFYDSDHEIELRVGKKIKTIFQESGEDYFRAIEKEIINDLCQKDHIVLATGGGAVINPVNRRILKESGRVVYLRATPSELSMRMRKDSSRPLLQGVDPKAKLAELYSQRDFFYREIADFIIDTGRPSVNHLVSLVLMQLELGS